MLPRGSTTVGAGLERLHKRGRGGEWGAGSGCSRVDVIPALHHLVAPLLHCLEDAQACHIDGDTTHEQAIAKVMRENPQLYDDYLVEEARAKRAARDV